MPKRNRDKLHDQSLYDLLCMMNERAMPDKCILQLIDEKEDVTNLRCEKYYCDPDESGIGCMNDCMKNYACCKKCIADYLNEFPF